jgi:radical SAM protein
MSAAGFSAVDFSRTPFLVIWEVTRACALACVHCRASAISRRDPRELTTEEGCRLIDQVRTVGLRAPILVLTGGDPMRRQDLGALVRHAADAELTVVLSAAATRAMTRTRLAALKDAGLSRLAVGLDGPDAATHDAARRVPGSYAQTLCVIQAAADLALPLHIDTTVTCVTLPHLESLARRVAAMPVGLWTLFFLVRAGRGAGLDQINADECEHALNYLYDLSLASPFDVATADAPHYERVAWQREDDRSQAGLPTQADKDARRRHFRAPRGVTDGKGLLFVDHAGNICPSGFLPVPRGNVRTASLADVYRHDEVFTRLRDSEALHGKCRRCQFRVVCGGSRSRAFAATGAVMASDPLCAYEPAAQIEAVVS